MTAAPKAAISTTFVPSELDWLNGEKFAGKKTFNDWEASVLGSEAKVSLKQLTQAVIAVALLANEQAGAIRLEARPKKTLFGLRTVTTLYAVPGDTTPAWPEWTLDADIRMLAEQLQANKGRNEVETVVYNLLKEDSSNPWGEISNRVGDALARRGLLETKEVKTLKIFRSTAFVLPESTSALLAQEAVDPVQQLLAGVEQQRPEIWKLLKAHVEKGLNQRVESSDNDNN